MTSPHAQPGAHGTVKYRTIVADPPWDVPTGGPLKQPTFGKWERVDGKRASLPYQVLSIQAIRALPVSEIAARDAHLYLWAPNSFLEQAFGVVRAWGFTPSIVLSWCKQPSGLGLGGTYVNTTEFVVFARRGSLPALQRQNSTWWLWRRPQRIGGGPAHSAKPEAFIDLVEQVSPGPYVELFSRRHRLGWDVWGNESANTAAFGESA